MTLKQTRQLGIEFERKIQTIDPTRVILRKIDTEDIYAYLNRYQESYVRQIHLADQQAESNTKQSTNIQDVLRTLTVRTTQTTPIEKTDSYAKYEVPSDYWMYQRSYISATGTYKDLDNSINIPCVQMKPSDINDLEDKAFDKDRIIRMPIVDIASTKSGQDTYNVYFDRYTKIESSTLIYIRKPKDFSILTETPCELPMTCFNDIVLGAVDLYVADAYKLTAANSKPRNNQNNEQQ